MSPGDRVVVAFVEKLPKGTILKGWPLHITIIPWFRLDIASDQLAVQLKKQYVGSVTFKVEVRDEVQLGYVKQKSANVVDAPELARLEGQTRRLLHSHRAWIVDEADKTRRGFHPHVTAQPTSRLHSGDTFECDRLYIVSQHGGFKQIDAVIMV